MSALPKCGTYCHLRYSGISKTSSLSGRSFHFWSSMCLKWHQHSGNWIFPLSKLDKYITQIFSWYWCCVNLMPTNCNEILTTNSHVGTYTVITLLSKNGCEFHNELLFFSHNLKLKWSKGKQWFIFFFIYSFIAFDWSHVTLAPLKSE